MRFVRPTVSLFFLLAPLAGCAAAKPQAVAPKACPPQNVTVELLASPTVNPSADGQARAVVVRVYQLKSDARMANASFDDVWRDDKTALGEDLVKMDEVQVYPGTRADVKFDRAPATAHVAAVALFQNPKGRAWVTTLDLPPIPEDGKCGPAVCGPDDDDDCDPRASTAPKLLFWFDGSKVDDGVEHGDEFPKPGPMKTRKGP